MLLMIMMMLFPQTFGTTNFLCFTCTTTSLSAHLSSFVKVSTSDMATYDSLVIDQMMKYKALFSSGSYFRSPQCPFTVLTNFSFHLVQAFWYLAALKFANESFVALLGWALHNWKYTTYNLFGFGTFILHVNPYGWIGEIRSSSVPAYDDSAEPCLTLLPLETLHLLCKSDSLYGIFRRIF